MNHKTDPRRSSPASRSQDAAGAGSGSQENGRSYFMSSIDLQNGLEISEEELQTLPPEFEAMFGPRPAG